MARHDTSCCTSSRPSLGFLASTYFSPHLSVGASAALFGLIGAMIAAGMRSNTAMGAAIKAQYTQWVIYMVVIGLLPFFNIDTAAHLGGLAGGFALAWLMDTPRTSGRGTDTMWRILAGFCVALTALSFMLMLRYASPRHTVSRSANGFGSAINAYGKARAGLRISLRHDLTVVEDYANPSTTVSLLLRPNR